jgi:hypothetical protein
VLNVLKSGSLNLLEPSGPERPVMRLLYLYSSQQDIPGERINSSAVRTSNPLTLTGKLRLSNKEANINENRVIIKEGQKYHEIRENFIIRRFMI